MTSLIDIADAKEVENLWYDLSLLIFLVLDFIILLKVRYSEKATFISPIFQNVSDLLV